MHERSPCPVPRGRVFANRSVEVVHDKDLPTGCRHGPERRRGSEEYSDERRQPAIPEGIRVEGFEIGILASLGRGLKHWRVPCD